MRFVMTGMGPMGQKIGVRIAKTPDLGNRFHLLANLEDVSAVLSIYDVLVVPSDLDGRPMIVLEALAAGIPVVASRVGGLPELIEPGSYGELCDAGDLAAFANAIAALEADPARLERYKAAARRFAEEQLDARHMVRRFERVLS